MSRWVAVARRTLSKFLADDCIGLAKEIAFSSVLALFPALAFLLGLLGILHLYDQLLSFVATVVPAGAVKFIAALERDQRDGAKVGALLVGAVGATWAASGAMASVIKAVNRAHDLRETRSVWKLRAIGVVLALLFGLTIAAVAVLIVVGAPVGRAIDAKTGLGGAFVIAWGIARWPVAFAAILLLFGLVYYLGPDAPRRWRWLSPGSLLGAVLWLALSGLFALYVELAGHYSRTYGSIAAGIVLLLWLNFTAWAILLGAELDSVLDA